MDLSISKRLLERKKDPKRLRRERKVPAVLYVKGQPSEPIMIDLGEFEAHLRQIVPGHLPTTIFVLKDAEGRTRKAIVKDIQYHVTTYNIVHLDFEELLAGTRVNVRVPITYLNAVDCQGVKLGGVLRQAMRHVRVNCPAERIPQEYAIDLRDMVQGDSRKVRDLELGEGVKSLDQLGEVAVMIAKR